MRPHRLHGGDGRPHLRAGLRAGDDRRRSPPGQGAARPSSKRFFASKQECAVAALEEMIASNQRAVRGGFRGRAGLAGLVARGAYAQARWIVDNPRKTRFGMLETLWASELTSALRDQLFGEYVAMVDAGRSVAPDPDSVPPLAAEGVVGSIAQVLARYSERGRGARPLFRRTGDDVSGGEAVPRRGCRPTRVDDAATGELNGNEERDRAADPAARAARPAAGADRREPAGAADQQHDRGHSRARLWQGDDRQGDQAGKNLPPHLLRDVRRQRGLLPSGLRGELRVSARPDAHCRFRGEVADLGPRRARGVAGEPRRPPEARGLLPHLAASVDDATARGITRRCASWSRRSSPRRRRRPNSVAPGDTRVEALAGGLSRLAAIKVSAGKSDELPVLLPDLVELFLRPFVGSEDAIRVAWGDRGS